METHIWLQDGFSQHCLQIHYCRSRLLQQEHEYSCCNLGLSNNDINFHLKHYWTYLSFLYGVVYFNPFPHTMNQQQTPLNTYIKQEDQ